MPVVGGGRPASLHTLFVVRFRRVYELVYMPFCNNFLFVSLQLSGPPVA